MTGTEELIRHALNTGAEYRAATRMDWAQFQRRLHPTPPRPVPVNHRRWLLPAAAATAAAALIGVGVFVGARTSAPNRVTFPAAQLTVVSAPVASFSCTGSDGHNMTTLAARLPDALELGKPIDVGIQGSTFCAAFAEGFSSTPLADTGPLRAFIATGGAGNVTVGVVDSSVSAITFTSDNPVLAPTSVTTVVDLGGGLRGFYVPVHTAGSVTVTVQGGPTATTSVQVIHGKPSLYPTGVSPSAVTSAVLPPQTVTCTSVGRLDNSITIAVTTPTAGPAPGTARLGYETVPHTTGNLPAQCLLVTEGGRTLSGRTALGTRQVLQYAGRVDGAHGTYQFISATGIAKSIRLTRADGTHTTLTAHQLTPTPNGFLTAAIYTPHPDPDITQATAIDANGHDLNTLHLP